MAYVILPNSGQSLGVTRPQINTNFALIQQVFDINHYDFNTANAGKHTFVNLPVYIAFGTPPPTTLAGEGAIYSNTVSGETELFYTRDANAANYQLTGTVDISTPTVAGSTSLPGGLMLQWGVRNAQNGTAVTFKNPFTLAGVNTPAYAVTATSNDSNANTFNMIKAGTITATGFTFQILKASNSGDTAFQNISWIAIGPNT